MADCFFAAASAFEKDIYQYYYIHYPFSRSLAPIIRDEAVVGRITSISVGGAACGMSL